MTTVCVRISQNKLDMKGCIVNTSVATIHMEKALTLSQQMLAMAENQEWENIESTLKLRDDLLQKLFDISQQQALTPEENQQLGNSFSEIQGIQKKIQLLAEKTHNNIKSTLKDSQKNSKALKSYNANR